MRSPDISPNWSRPGSVCAVSAVTTQSPPGCCRCGVFPAFPVGCSQVVLPGEEPALVRNYDYDQALFEAVIASTDYSGRRRVLGTSDMLCGSCWTG